MMRWTYTVVALAAAATLAASNAEAQQGGALRRGGSGPPPAESNGRSNVPQSQEKRFPLGSAWIAVSMNGKPFGGSERPSFTLTENFRATGFGGCNTFSATAFPLKAQGIAVGPLALTKRACDGAVMANEKAFLTALRTSAKWDTVVGSLVIKGPNGELKFERSL